MSKKWQTIGEVWVDSATIVICDPCHADDAIEGWHDYVNKTDLNEAAVKNQGAAQLENDRGTPIGVITNTGLGDGCYAVEARYETDPDWGKRCAEIRIKFLPHPYFEGRE